MHVRAHHAVAALSLACLDCALAICRIQRRATKPRRSVSPAGSQTHQVQTGRAAST